MKRLKYGFFVLSVVSLLAGAPGSNLGSLLLREAVAAGGSDFVSAAGAGNHGQVRAFIRKSTDIDQRDDFGNTALMAAAENGHLGTAKILVGAKADPNCANERGETALILAAGKGFDRMVKFLITPDTALDMATLEERTTALMAAVQNGHVAVVNLLVEAKASRRLRNKDGLTARDIADQTKQAEIMEILRKADFIFADCFIQ